MNLTHRCATAMLAGVVGFACAPAASQDYPVRPVRIVIPFPAGGASDIVVRAVGEQLAKAMGQPFVPENKPGAGGAIAASEVARATPDGHVLLYGNTGNMVQLPALQPALAYQPRRDFAPVALAVHTNFALVVNPSTPVQSLSELLAWQKARSAPIRFGSVGVGSTIHIMSEWLAALTGTNMIHVGYKGSPPMLADLMGGHIDMAFDNVATALPLARNGKLRALAVSSARRLAIAPELPTVAEAGIPRFAIAPWQGFLAPAATPPAVLDRLNQEINRALQTAQVRERLTAAGFEVAGGSREDFGAVLARDADWWFGLIRELGIRLE